MNTIEKLLNGIDFKNITYHYKCFTANVNFNDFIDVASVSDEINSSRIKLADAEKNQMEFKSKPSDIRARGRKSDKQNNEDY